MKTKDTTITQFKESIKPQRLTRSTVNSYSACIMDLLRFHESIKPSKITKAQVQEFINHRIDQGISPSYQNVYVNAINLWQQYTYNRKRVNYNYLRPKRRKKLPKVPSLEQVKVSFSKIKNKKHKAICALMYLAGFRVGEVINSEYSWFNRFNQTIHIIGKGVKDGIVPYSDELREILNDYYREYRTEGLLFQGQKKEHYSASSIRAIVKRYFNTNPHTLRHAFAVHLVKKKTDIYRIQELLRHEDIRITLVYLQLDCSDLMDDVQKLTISIAADRLAA